MQSERLTGDANIIDHNDSSILGSVAERTDNIINYSGALNTSEEFIENVVNVSGTLGAPPSSNQNNMGNLMVVNPYSIVSSASKPKNSGGSNS